MSLTVEVVASFVPTQEVAGSSPFTVITTVFVTEFSEKIRENSKELILSKALAKYPLIH